MRLAEDGGGDRRRSGRTPLLRAGVAAILYTAPPDSSEESRQLQLTDELEGWSYYYDDESLYINVWLRCEGENVKSVEFSTSEGFFARQTIPETAAERDGVQKGYMGNADGSARPIIYGTDFERLGGSIVLEKADLTSDILLFWGCGKQADAWPVFPEKIVIRATATFIDGKTQEETVTIDLSKGPAVGIGKYKGSATEPIIYP